MKLKHIISLIVSVSFLAQQQAFASMQKSSLTEPEKPNYENCQSKNVDNDAIQYDYSCIARNQAKEREYNLLMYGHNVAKSEEAKAIAEAKTAEQAELAKVEQQNSAQKLMQEAEQKNKKGSQKYQAASIACGLASAGFAGAFAASCAGAGATCNYYFLAASIAFATFSVLAAKQASSHDSVAHSACQSANKMSTSPANCGVAPSPYPPQSFPSTQVAGVTGLFDANGKCISTPDKCAGVISSLPPGVNIKDAMKGVSAFASGKVPFKVNADGSITDKKGKKFTAANFASEKDMIAAGLSASEAKSLIGEIKKAEMSSALSSAKADLDKANSQDLVSLTDVSTAASGAKANGVSENGNATGSKDMKSTNREPASAEGLAKGFNGELIGVAGDDIFKMMNRRYKLKSAQDSFIGP
jgi:hypothetical protein